MDMCRLIMQKTKIETFSTRMQLQRLRLLDVLTDVFLI